MRAICMRVDRIFYSEMVKWLVKNTDAWQGSGYAPYITFDNMSCFSMWAWQDDFTPPDGYKLVTPNEFKRRVQAACGKGG